MDIPQCTACILVENLLYTSETLFRFDQDSPLSHYGNCSKIEEDSIWSEMLWYTRKEL